MKVKTDGLILKQSQVGESDRLVWVLTRELGLIRAFARGAQKPKSKKASGTSMLCFSNFSVSQTKDSYIIEEAEPVDIFFNLRLDISKLSLAQYFSEVILAVAVEGEESDNLLRLMLNCLHVLEKELRPLDMIKAVFELRLMCEIGYTPDIFSCSKCSKEKNSLFFFANEGTSVCEDCGVGTLLLSGGILKAMRFVISAEPTRIFSFELSDYKPLTDVTEYYLKAQLNKNFTALDFYKNLPEGN